MKTRTIRQTITLPVSPETVYATLLDGRKMSGILGSKASFSRKVKGNFSVFDGYCRGHNIRLIPGQYIEQAWVFREPGWPEDHFSVCTFLLTPAISGTKLAFKQKGVPENHYEDIRLGWKSYYWTPLKACFIHL